MVTRIRHNTTKQDQEASDELEVRDDGTVGSEVITPGPATERAAEALSDDESVSSERRDSEDGEVEAPVIGTAGAPATTLTADGVEPVPGYDHGMIAPDRRDERTAGVERHVLDAWYADNASSVTRALVLRQPALVTETLEVVIGVDDRRQITNTTAYPWRWLCSLLITAADGSAWIGTGWLAGPRTVITAGHCVFIHNRGGWVQGIEVIPGRNGRNQPFNSCRATRFRSVRGWTEQSKRSHDYGAILLPSDCPLGEQTGTFGYAKLSDSALAGLTVNLSGYPGDKPAGTQWFHARSIDSVTERTIVYNIDTAGGQSGAPVWRLVNGVRHVVGIHTNGDITGNSATRIVQPVFDNIKKWKDDGAT